MDLSPKLLVADAAELTGTSVQNIHKKIREKGLKANKAQNRVYFGHSVARKVLGLKFSPTVYSFQLVKGGVGKTAISFNFAIRSALLGAKVAVIELDQQANLTRTFGIDASNSPIMIDIVNQKLDLSECLVPVFDGVDLLPSRVDNALLDNTLLLGKYPLDKVFFHHIKKLKRKKYDVIIIDCPPSISASVSAAALVSDVIVMPVNPTDYSMAGLELTYRELKDLFGQYGKKAKMKVLFNKYDGRTSLSFHIMEDLIKHPVYGKLLIRSYIRSTQSIENSISQGKSVFDTLKTTNEKEDFSTVTNILLGLQNG